MIHAATGRRKGRSAAPLPRNFPARARKLAYFAPETSSSTPSGLHQPAPAMGRHLSGARERTEQIPNRKDTD